MAEKYQLFDPLRPEEYAALKADIQKHGVLVPVELDQDGNILDGHNRAAIAAELGREYPTVVRHFASEADKREHVLKINLLRRHLGPVAWADGFQKLATARGVQTGPGRPRLDHNNGVTVSQLAAELGVNERTAYRRLDLADQLADVPDLAAKVDTGDMTPKRALRVKREREAVTRAAIPVEAPAVPGLDLRLGDFRSVLADIPDGSVDLVFTDPPYPAEYLPLWSDLAAFATRVLKPGRLMVAYSGQYHLPAVLKALTAHLEYIWVGGLFTPGPANQVQQRHVRSNMKPLLFCARAPYEAGEWFDDAYTSEERAKDDHDWQQSLGAASYYIERLTKAGGTVVDPFLGSGTTGLAARNLSRSFIGADIDPVAFATASRRLAE